MRKNLMVLLLVFAVVGSFIATKHYDNRERNLAEVFAPYADQYKWMVFRLDGHGEWYTEEKKPVEELQDFLGQYQVKKMTDDEWDSNVSRERGFSMNIVNGHKPLAVLVLKERIMWRDGYFHVLNGPIDMEWVKEFYDTYRE